MKWFTAVGVEKSSLHLGYQDKILTSGSCFSQVIGSKLLKHKFETLVNPFGTVYNPVSICEQLTNEQFKEEQTIVKDGVWSHFGYHSSFNSLNKDTLEQRLKEAHAKVKSFCPSALLITFGTAWVYERNGTLVANCHKFPEKEFGKRLLSVNEILDSFSELYKKFATTKIILTLSPVRHLRENLEGNAVSKSVLRLAIYEIEQNWPVAYFPAYEIMLDELRDYRFYAEDLLHPSEAAAEEIWERFRFSFFDPKTDALHQRVRSALLKLSHRPQLIGSEAHERLLNDLSLELAAMGQINWQKEIDWIQNQISMLQQS